MYWRKQAVVEPLKSAEPTVIVKDEPMILLVGPTAPKSRVPPLLPWLKERLMQPVSVARGPAMVIPQVSLTMLLPPPVSAHQA